MTCLADMDTILEETRFRTVSRMRVFTDASGNFLFTNPPTGQHVLLISGPTDLYPGSVPSACPRWGVTER